MNKKFRIGLFGAPARSNNMGCLALTYSLLGLLRDIEQRNSLEFEYMIFDGGNEEAKRNCLADYYNIPRERLIEGRELFPKNAFYTIPRLNKLIAMIVDIKSCNVIIDITGGDSFTDIYGDDRFIGRTRVKLLICKLGIPLILGPQTYGPFNKDRNKKLAARVLKNANLIMARDKISAKVVEDLSNKSCYLSLDLAFKLPYEKQLAPATKKKKIGINVSGMLYKAGYENVTANTGIKVDYQQYVVKLIENILKEDIYEIYLIPHVGNDLKAMKDLAEIFHERVTFCKMGDTPIQMKNIISGMDFFVGSRMHATIAAFTAGVPCIPVAYSMKFKGVFDLVNYPVLVDLTGLDTETAVETTLNYIKNGEAVKKVQESSLNDIDSVSYASELEPFLLNIVSKFNEVDR